MSKDYYNILGVSKDASKEEIKKAYKKLAKKYHPDVSKEANAEDKFKELNEAAEVLLDENKKHQYDAYGTTGNQQGFGGGSSGFDFGDFGFGNSGFSSSNFGIDIDEIFESFGFGGRGGKKRRQNKGYKSIFKYYN